MPKYRKNKIEKILIESLLLTKDGVALFSPDDRMIFCNDAAAALFGVTGKEALNKTFSELCLNCFNEKMGVNIESEEFQPWIDMALNNRRSINHRRFETDTVDNKFFMITEQMVQENYMYTYITDITEQKNYENKLQLMSKELEKLATTDYLTGIRNRRYFYEMARAEFNRSKRENVKLTVLILDLDKFKLINDNYGHNAGDTVLKTITETISKLLRDYDIFARIGGEEFAILLPSTGIELGNNIAERIRVAIESLKIVFENEKLTITTSIGLVENNDNMTSFEQMLQVADGYLNKAKNQGRNKVLSS